jgi:RNA polymerase sigma factor (sigma-70 family)
MMDTNFISNIKDLPLLTAEREKELGKIIQKFKKGKKKDEAIIELVEHNIRLAINEAYKYSRMSSVPIDELYSAGRAGLIRAAYDYNPVKFKTRFSTYATPWIRQGIRETIHGNSPVKIPMHIVNGLYRKNKAVEANGDMSNGELCKELELTEAQLDKINKAHISSVSLNMPLSPHGSYESGDHLTLGDVMPDPDANIPGEDGLDDPRHDFLMEAMGELDEMSQEIIKAQILNADKTNLSDLGERFCISGERVRQIKDNALNQMKKKIVYRMSINGLKVSQEILDGMNEPSKKKRGRPRKKT